MVMCHDHEECLGTSHHQEQSFYTRCVQTADRWAHRACAQQTSQVAGSTVSQREPRERHGGTVGSGDAQAWSENKSRYKVRYRDYYPETRVTCPMVDSGGEEVRLAT